MDNLITILKNHLPLISILLFIVSISYGWIKIYRIKTFLLYPLNVHLSAPGMKRKTETKRLLYAYNCLSQEDLIVCKINIFSKETKSSFEKVIDLASKIFLPAIFAALATFTVILTNVLSSSKLNGSLENKDQIISETTGVIVSIINTYGFYVSICFIVFLFAVTEFIVNRINSSLLLLHQLVITEVIKKREQSDQ
jgi:hypothetical protein